MVQYTVAVEGMACGMCEAHVNDAVRRAFPVRQVKSSRSRKETVIVCDAPLDEAQLRKVIDDTGYAVGEIRSAPYERRGLFGRR